MLSEVVFAVPDDVWRCLPWRDLSLSANLILQ